MTPLIPHFDLLATAPGGVARLRELILTLAVQGKLVPQEAGDEPASVCLARISNSRANDRLTAKSERARLATALADDERPFSLPQGWAWACLAEFAQSRLGKMLDKAKNTGKLYPYLRNTNVQWGRIDLDDVKLIRLDIHELNEYRLQIGDLLVCEGGEPGRCAIWSDQTREMYFQKALHRIRPEGGVSPKFLAICLEADARSGRLAQQFTGATIKHFAGQELEKYTVALPPVSEQSRIVTRVEELMRLCDALEQQRQLETAQHAQLLNTLLGTLTDCTSPDELAAHWQRVSDHFDLLLDRPEAVDALEQTIVKLAIRGLLTSQSNQDQSAANLVASINDGRVTRRKKDSASIIAIDDQDFLPQGWCVTNIGCITECLDYIRRPIKKSERESDKGLIPYYGANGQVGTINDYLFDEDLVLVVEDETFIGRIKPFSYIIRGKSWVNNHAHVLRPLGGISVDYLNLCLERYDFIPLTSGTTNRRKLTQVGLLEAKLMIAPLAEQTRIVARVTQLRDLCTTLRQRLAAGQTTQRHLAEALVEV